MWMRTAVVGHVEWVTFARVEAVPRAGAIVHASETCELPAGGGPVAAVQLLKLAGSCDLYTALGDDELGHRALAELEALGLRVHSVFRPEAQRRAFTMTDGRGERTIVVMGSRLGPHESDPLPWDELAGADAVYFCAGDDDALRAARRAGVLVATLRECERLSRVGVALDAVVGSARDPSEAWEPGSIDPSPGAVVRTRGSEGGTYQAGDGPSEAFGPSELPGPVADTYGCGDSFAAGLTFGLGSGLDIPEAIALAARCGAACLTGRGPYEGQLES